MSVGLSGLSTCLFSQPVCLSLLSVCHNVPLSVCCNVCHVTPSACCNVCQLRLPAIFTCLPRFLIMSHSLCLPQCLFTTMSVCHNVCLPQCLPHCLSTTMSVCNNVPLSVSYDSVCQTRCLSVSCMSTENSLTWFFIKIFLLLASWSWSAPERVILHTTDNEAWLRHTQFKPLMMMMHILLRLWRKDQEALQENLSGGGIHWLQRWRHERESPVAIGYALSERVSARIKLSILTLEWNQDNKN